MLETVRLRLRQWCATDLELFGALNADPRVMEFYLSPLDRAAGETWRLTATSSGRRQLAAG